MIATAQSSRTGGLSRLLLYSVAVLVILGGGGYYWMVLSENKPLPIDDSSAIRAAIAKILDEHKMADRYQDADKDLVADAPADASKLQKVEQLGFCLVAGDDPERSKVEWKDFMAALEKATGKKVVYVEDLTIEDAQLSALRNGKLHVTAFSTGGVAKAVNTAGFVPLVSPANAEGKFSYEMEIIVPASSSVKDPKDLKDKTLAFTTLASNSGARAPMVILKEKFSLLPGRDYKYVHTGGHSHSIKQMSEGKLDAACVANDLLASAVAAGSIKADQYRSIYKSASFPPLCLGMAHDLPSDVAAAIKKTFADFRFEGTSLEKRFKSQGTVRFAPVDYKRDWAFVREIDEKLAKLLD
jgi:phosphonate transport system substrate-binding protein